MSNQRQFFIPNGTFTPLMTFVPDDPLFSVRGLGRYIRARRSGGVRGGGFDRADPDITAQVMAAAEAKRDRKSARLAEIRAAGGFGHVVDYAMEMGW